MSVYMNYERVHGAYIIGRVSDEDEIKAACEEFNALSDYLERINARDYMDEVGNIILLKPDELESFYNEISVEDMALALKGCSPRMRVQILNKMEGRKSFDINYQMDCMGPARLDDIEKAQGRVLKAILESQKS